MGGGGRRGERGILRVKNHPKALSKRCSNIYSNLYTIIYAAQSQSKKLNEAM
jgi:hypothetical protein